MLDLEDRRVFLVDVCYYKYVFAVFVDVLSIMKQNLYLISIQIACFSAYI